MTQILEIYYNFLIKVKFKMDEFKVVIFEGDSMFMFGIDIFNKKLKVHHEIFVTT